MYNRRCCVFGGRIITDELRWDTDSAHRTATVDTEGRKAVFDAVPVDDDESTDVRVVIGDTRFFADERVHVRVGCNGTCFVGIAPCGAGPGLAGVPKLWFSTLWQNVSAASGDDGTQDILNASSLIMAENGRFLTPLLLSSTAATEQYDHWVDIEIRDRNIAVFHGKPAGVADSGETLHLNHVGGFAHLPDLLNRGEPGEEQIGDWCLFAGPDPAVSTADEVEDTVTVTNLGAGGKLGNAGHVSTTAVEDLHAMSVSNHSVRLAWTPHPAAYSYSIAYAHDLGVGRWELFPEYMTGIKPICFRLADGSTECTDRALVTCTTLPCYASFVVANLSNDIGLYTFRVGDARKGLHAAVEPDATTAAVPSGVVPSKAPSTFMATEIRHDYIQLIWTPAIGATHHRLRRRRVSTEDASVGVEWETVHDRLLCADPVVKVRPGEASSCLHQRRFTGETNATTALITHTIEELEELNGVEFEYAISGYNNHGEGPAAKLNATAMGLLNETATDLYIDAATTSSLTLSWTHVQGASRYRVQAVKANENDSAFVTVADDLDSGPFTFGADEGGGVLKGSNVFINGNGTQTGLLEGQNYTLRVFAGNENGYQLEGATITDFPHGPAENAVINLTIAEATMSSVLLTWRPRPLTTARQYRIEYRLASQPDDAFANPADFLLGSDMTPAEERKYNVTGLQSGNEYVFRILGVNRAGVAKTGESLYWHVSQTVYVGVEDSLNALFEATGGNDHWVTANGWDGRDTMSTGEGVEWGEANHCSWHGVTCNLVLMPTSFAAQRGLVCLEGTRLGFTGSDTLPDDCVVWGVEMLVLSRNNLYGHIPPEIGQLWALKSLDLSQNHIAGTFPVEFAQLHLLESVDLSGNALSSHLPPSVDRLAKVRVLNLANNRLTGTLTTEMFKMLALEDIDLSSNEIDGEIDGFGFAGLRKLSRLDLSNNRFNGTVPAELGQSGEIVWIGLSYNLLSSSLPPEIARLTDATEVHARGNLLEGAIPRELSSMARLRVLDLAENKISSTIPTELEHLTLLSVLDLGENLLSGTIRPELAALTELRHLRAQENALSGTLPSFSTDQLQSIEQIWIDDNAVSGVIPTEWCTLTTLTDLRIRRNVLSGEIPSQVGALVQLRFLDIGSQAEEMEVQMTADQQSGEEGSTLTGLSGFLPSELGLCSNLIDLRVDQNALSGTLPLQLSNLVALQDLNIAENLFDGSLFDTLGSNLVELSRFSCQGNRLFGPVPLRLQSLCRCLNCSVAQDVCGDGLMSGPDEACDDGNTDDMDGCSASCKREPGWQCSENYFGLTTCEQVCGDGVRTVSEFCDDGNYEEGDGCSGCVEDDGWNCQEDAELRSHCLVICGDGIILVNETCDDGNSAPLDGCNQHCRIERGFICELNPSESSHTSHVGPSLCREMCGDGIRTPSEQCDDGGFADDDGCDHACRVEFGWRCSEDSSDRSSCFQPCGDGLVAPSEACDDKNDDDDDGCTGCKIDYGWSCWEPIPGGPSICAQVCGDGVRTVSEACDDANEDDYDGCTNCTIDSGWICETSTSTGHSECEQVCGNGQRTQDEECDDGNDEIGDGCEECRISYGFYCSEPDASMPLVASLTTCTTMCGDGIRTGGEECDDGDLLTANDGCAADCREEHGWECIEDTTLHSSCFEVCGNGVRTYFEFCDDDNQVDGDGCSAGCTVETGFSCSEDASGFSHCADTCGDGVNNFAEEGRCDDNNFDSGDGCDENCFIEEGWDCQDQETGFSLCVAVCGDGLLVGTEVCDNSNTDDGDGCSGDCSAIEENHVCDTASSPSECCLFHEGVEYAGGSITTLTDIQSPEQCCRACAEKTACDRWVLVRPGQGEDVYYCDLRKSASSEASVAQAAILQNLNQPPDFDTTRLVSGIPTTGNE